MPKNRVPITPRIPRLPEIEIPADAPMPPPNWRRDRDRGGEDRRLPLYKESPPSPNQIPPGWVPDGHGGYKRDDSNRDGDGGYGITFEM
jgi:hypothetical protein